jgi:hypothetical protein
MRTVLDGVEFWRHDLSSCLQDCLATLLIQRGHDPVLALGAAWDFHHAPGDYRHQEYYYPRRWGGLAESVLPYHPVTSHWREETDPAAAWEDVRAEVAAGRPAIVAVDNYHLPFRPAYGDVHTNHLVVVYGFDDEAGEVHVLDSKPPRYRGPIRAEELRAARSSANPAVHDRDLFYTQQPIRGGWLQVSIGEDFPAPEPGWVDGVIRQNVERFRAGGDGGAFSGLAGLRDYLAGVAGRARDARDPGAMDELYVAGWAAQQSAGLHADFLAAAGCRLGRTRLAEAGREVDCLAHHWSDLRMLGAHCRAEPAAAASRIRRRAAQLVADTERVLAQLEVVTCP